MKPDRPTDSHEPSEYRAFPIKAIVAAIVGVLLILVALFAVAILIPVEEDPRTGSKSDKRTVSLQVGANSSVVAARTDLALDADKQMTIWNIEHMAMTIENRFGRAFCTAFKSRDVEKLGTFFLDGDLGPEHALVDSIEQTHGIVTSVTRRFKLADGASTAKEVIELLLGSTEKMSTCNSMKVRVLSLEPAEGSSWQSRLVLEALGTMEDGKPCAVESNHSVQFKIGDAAKMDFLPSIAGWSVNDETLWGADKLLMKELPGLDHDITLRPLDNWRNQRPGRGTNIKQESIPPHRFQTAVGDYDGDGDPDIAVIDGRRRIVFRNDDGKFTYATRLLGMRDEVNTTIAPVITWFDFDNDGNLDLLSGTSLHKNVDGEKLEDVTEESRLVFGGRPPAAVCPCDFDCDGLVDLYVPLGITATSESWIQNSQGIKNQLWRNVGGGVFEDVTETAKVSGGERDSTGAVWLFANEDHYPDLFVVNDLTESTLFLNNGNGTFTDASESIRPTRPTGFVGGAASGDVDNDGRPDLYLSGLYSTIGNRLTAHLSQEDYQEAGTYDRMRDLCSGSRLYRFGEGPSVTDITEQAGVGRIGYSWGAAMFDIDNDGWLDLYGTSGFRSSRQDLLDVDTCIWRRVLTAPNGRSELIPQIGNVDDEAGEFWAMNDQVTDMLKHNVHSFERNRLFLNQSGTSFMDASFASAVDLMSDSRGAIPADFDGDGAIDLLVASVGGGSLRLFLNQMPQGHRLKIRLVGTTSNKFGIGARVTATIGDRQVVRDLFPTVGFMSNGPAELWIGAGESATIDRLSVRWPTGETQEFENVSTNQSIEIREDESEFTQKATFE